ncbi:hypothetical protein [Streptomyces sp. KL116D]|uniref:hypothetical protein n=1 Tax=Streptomyces sp. KL116D TaxID=3045152 RepID=UPI00355864B3
MAPHFRGRTSAPCCAAAAIGGLVFTAVATYFNAVVAQDQLTQSQADAERDRRGQAMRVSYWTENPVATPCGCTS